MQNWSKKGSGEKGRGGGGSKLPPRFAKKQQQQQGMAAGQQQQQPSAPAPQTQSVLQQQQPQPQQAISVSQHNLPASNQSTSSPQPLEGAVAPLAPPPVDFSAKSQTHSTLGTELWENKVAGSTVLSDVKKRKCLTLNPCLLKPHTLFINVCCNSFLKNEEIKSCEFFFDKYLFFDLINNSSVSDGCPISLLL